MHVFVSCHAKDNNLLCGTRGSRKRLRTFLQELRMENNESSSKRESIISRRGSSSEDNCRRILNSIRNLKVLPKSAVR